ncbi:MAG: hypothetical protein RLZ22_1506, partial [Verrucomicrobiota bacterium]
MKRISFASIFLIALFVCSSHANTSAPRPNFLIILTDDHGYGDV